MSSLANSKKGFRKLETLEMVELNGGNLLDDSGSETELLDLTNPTKTLRRETNSCSSCCCWCGVLYAGLLTVFVMVVGVVSAYALNTAWQLSLTMNSSRQPIRDEIDSLRKAFMSHKKTESYTLDGVSETMFQVNASFTTMNGSIWRQINDTSRRLALLEQKTSGSREQRPQDFNLELDAIHKELASLLDKVSALNSSLHRVDEVQLQTTSFSSVLDSLSARMDALSRTTGDTIHSNTNIQDSIQGFGDRILNFETRIAAMEKNVSTCNSRIQQTAQYLDKNITQLHSMMSALNVSFIQELTHMLVNMTQTLHVMKQLQKEFKSLADEYIPDSHPATATGHESTTSQPVSAAPEESHTTLATVNNELTTTQTTEDERKEERAETTEIPATTATSLPTTIAATTTAATATATAEGTGHEQSSTFSDGTSEIEGSPSEDTTSPSEEASSHQGGGATSSAAVDSDSKLMDTTEDAQTKLDQKEAASNATSATNDDDDDGDGDGKSSSAVDLLKEILDSFDLLDISGDNQLSFKEFSLLANSPKAFQAIDFNNDKFVDKNEIETALKMIKHKNTSGQVSTASAT